MSNVKVYMKDFTIAQQIEYLKNEIYACEITLYDLPPKGNKEILIEEAKRYQIHLDTIFDTYPEYKI